MDHSTRPASRRQMLKYVAGGLGALAAGAIAIPQSHATEASGGHGGLAELLIEENRRAPVVAAPAQLAATEDNILGPFYRRNSPFRAKITPPLIAGIPLVVHGRVWGVNTKKPLAYAVIDVWQADSHGRYDNDDRAKPPAKGVYVNRARLLTDESGYYEFESIHPGRYKLDADSWRPSHVHYFVRAHGYKPLVTQLYFEGDPHNANDPFIKKSLIAGVTQHKAGELSYEEVTFDVVLEPA